MCVLFLRSCLLSVAIFCSALLRSVASCHRSATLSALALQSPPFVAWRICSCAPHTFNLVWDSHPAHFAWSLVCLPLQGQCRPGGRLPQVHPQAKRGALMLHRMRHRGARLRQHLVRPLRVQSNLGLAVDALRRLSGARGVPAVAPRVLRAGTPRGGGVDSIGLSCSAAVFRSPTRTRVFVHTQLVALLPRCPHHQSCLRRPGL